jgi:hypothetical protein
MNLKCIKKSFIIWLIIELLCAIAFGIIIGNKAEFTKLLTMIFSLILMTCLIVLLISVQIKRTWLNIDEGLGKLISIFWQVGSVIIILYTILDLFLKERVKVKVIIIPIFTATLLTGINWTNYMTVNNPVAVKKHIAKNKKLTDKNKIAI